MANKVKFLFKNSTTSNLPTAPQKPVRVKALQLDLKSPLNLQDATGREIVFPELKRLADITVGVYAEVEGKPAEGSYLMPNTQVLTFSKGLLIERITENRIAAMLPNGRMQVSVRCFKQVSVPKPAGMNRDVYTYAMAKVNTMLNEHFMRLTPLQVFAERVQKKHNEKNYLSATTKLRYALRPSLRNNN